MLDIFLWGTVKRISPEAPVPVVEIQKETRAAGGAANVAHNVATLGANVVLVGRIGDDSEGKHLVEILRTSGVKTDGIITENNCLTTVKTRIVAHSQQVVRFDRESREPLSRYALEHVSSFLKTLRAVDAVIISDYAKGVITAELMDVVRSWASSMGVPILVDPKVNNAGLFKNVMAITPNFGEALHIAGDHTDEDIQNIGRKIIDRLGCRYVLITRGSEGMSLFDQRGNALHLPTLARKVYDVTGAGDTVVATLTVGMCTGLTMAEAAYLANVAAGYVVGELGTATVSAEALKEAILRSCTE